MESLYAELVSNGIIQKSLPIHIHDYLGAFNFLGATLNKAGILADPSFSQIRNAITEYCILPLGSAYLHEKCALFTTVELLAFAPCVS